MQAFITGDTLAASNPVVPSLNDHASLVAYTVKKAGKDYIIYQPPVDLE